MSTFAGTMNQAGNAVARNCVDHYHVKLLPDRQQKNDCITRYLVYQPLTIKVTNMFSGLLYHISGLRYLNSPFHCFTICNSIFLRWPSSELLESRPATISNILRRYHRRHYYGCYRIPAEWRKSASIMLQKLFDLYF